MVASPAKGSFLVFFIAAEIMWYGDVLRWGIEERWRGTARLNAYVVLPTVRRRRSRDRSIDQPGGVVTLASARPD